MQGQGGKAGGWVAGLHKHKREGDDDDEDDDNGDGWRRGRVGKQVARWELCYTTERESE